MRSARRRARVGLPVLALVLLVALAVAGSTITAPPARAQNASASAPTITFGANLPRSPLRGGPYTLSASATAAAGQTVQSITFYYRPSGSPANAAWTPFNTANDFQSSSAPGPSMQSNIQFYSDQSQDPNEFPNGNYDFRAVATDAAGVTGEVIARDFSVANGPTYLQLSPTGSPVKGPVTLTARAEVGGATPSTVSFYVCPTTSDCSSAPGTASPDPWQRLATTGPQLDANGQPVLTPQGQETFQTTLDTTQLGDGSYDITTTAPPDNSNPSNPQTFQGGIESGLLIDNTPPSVSLGSVAGSMSAGTTLTAAAHDAGSGLAAVKFQVSPAGAGNWSTVGVATSPPYSATFDTRQFPDGSYDVRAEAIDAVGNVTDSSVSGTSISNPGSHPFGGLTVTNFVAPASRIQLLGELPGSQHETWALGQTDAPPPTVNGAPLPYTSQGDAQEVLLRFTEDTGWQIVDVLRRADGSAFPVGPSPRVTGAMTRTGEAWVVLLNVVNGKQVTGAFHRVPGGQFTEDAAAESALAPFLGPALPTMRLASAADGNAFGTIFQPGSGTSFATLVRGAWSAQGSSLPAGYTPPQGASVTLTAADASAPGVGWGLFDVTQNGGLDSLILARFDHNGWQFLPQTGLDALDLSEQFMPGTQESAADADTATVRPLDLRADSQGVWLSAAVGTTRAGAHITVVARYDAAASQVVMSWCGSGLPRSSYGCALPLDGGHPAAVPDATFSTPDGPVGAALSSSSDTIDVYEHGTWTAIPTPGFSATRAGQSTFADPTDGWVVGTNTLGRLTADPTPSPLASWPEPNRNPLLSVALPPGASTTDTAGALAVGLNGAAVHYDPASGWLVDPTPPRAHHIQLSSVAFDGASQAFAVGQLGVILRWNGTTWSEDPQSVSVTTTTLNSVAFGADGQGWAVGGRGTILHYDGHAWSVEQIDSADAGANLTSVAVAGQDVFAIARGNLIERAPDGTWAPVPSQSLPSPAPPDGSLRLVSGLPDGGLAIAGKSELITRQSAQAALQYAPQTFNGIPVGLSAFRAGDGQVRAFVSIAPPVATANGGVTNDVGGYPSGDGDLIVQSAGGWMDLSRDLPPTETYAAAGDGVVQPDPVLAIAASPDGGHAWAVGGYAGTHAADGIGTDQSLSIRPADWLTSAIWRYDVGGSTPPTSTSQSPVSIPATPGTVSFAFFSSPLCKQACAGVRDAQPDVNLKVAAGQIAAFAQQPGGPAFAMLGGNARGPIDHTAYANGAGAGELAALPQLLAPLSGVPTYAAYGPLDAVPTSSNPARPWADAFAGAPAPFGSGPAPAGITPDGSGDQTGPVSKYYAFDASQNGGTIRAIVLDNAAGSLEASAPGQTAWLADQLSAANAASVPVVVFAARPLNLNDTGAASDADAVAAQLAGAGVLGVFTTSGGTSGGWQAQPNRVAQIPADAAPGAPQVPEYEGATLTYQQHANNGVTWYDVSVDTSNRTLNVDAVPVISSLTLDPTDGLNVARSSTLTFQAIGRRPAATLATTPTDPSFPGYPQYVGIPASSCAGCVGPTYTFASSDPTVGNFVVPSAPGSRYPKLTPEGKTTSSSKSGLFCAYNSGTTTVSVTSGQLTSSLVVTVADGGYGPPCGTVAGGPNRKVIQIRGKPVYQQGGNPNIGTPNLGPGGAPISSPLPKIALPGPAPLPAPAPAPHPAPHPVPNPSPPAVAPPALAASPLAPAAGLGVPPFVPPLIPPALTPVPPGGATVSAQATAKREEKARKHASQSAFTIRPAGTDGNQWFFYPAVGGATVLTVLLIAGGLQPGPGRRMALLELDPVADSGRRARRR